MSVENLCYETFQTSRGNDYSYVYIAPRNRATLVLLHGFPSTSYDWIYQIRHFSSKGYGLLVPDLLGYGRSSKPSDIQQYRPKPMSDDLAELMASLYIVNAIGIGHDFGATLLSRLVAYYPSQFKAVVFLTVGPPKLGTPFNLEIINEMTKKVLGYELLGYIPWIGGDPDAPHLLEQHPEAAMQLMFASGSSVWKEWFHPLGKMKRFVSEDRRAEIGDWYLPEMQSEHIKSFGKLDGYKGAQMWYGMWLQNLFAPDEKGYEELQIRQPVLFIASDDEGSSSQEQMLRQWVSTLQVVKRDSGHWIHMERNDEVNRIIEEFIGNLEALHSS